MKSKFIGILLCLLALLFPMGTESHASLINIGGRIIRGDISNQYWIQDTTLLTTMIYQKQLDLIQSWNTNGIFGGISVGKWRMATVNDIETFEILYGGAELDSAFTPMLITPTVIYSNGRTNEFEHGLWGDPIHYVSSLGFIESTYGGLYYSTEFRLFDNDRSGVVRACVTADPVPVPAAVWLFGFGLAGLAAVRRHKQ